MGDAIPEVDEEGEMGEDNDHMGYDDGMDQEYDEHNDQLEDHQEDHNAEHANQDLIIQNEP